MELHIFQKLGVRSPVTIGSPVLPWTTGALPIIEKRAAQCSACKGCIPLRGVLSYFWQVGDWGACTKTCGSGEQ
jgi:hypothetical protein